MNDRPSSPRPWIAPELEARLAALVLGEASDFERDELERLMASRAELGIYRQRLVTVHAMLRQVGQGEVTPQAEQEWKLDPKRRALLLAKLGGVEAAKPPVARTKQGTVRRHTLLKVAAVLVPAALLLGMFFPAATGIQRSTKSADLEFAVEAVGTGNTYDHTRSKMLREVAEGWEAPESSLELQKRTAVPTPVASWEIPADAIEVPPSTPLNSLALAPSPSNPAAPFEPAVENNTLYHGGRSLEASIETGNSGRTANHPVAISEEIVPLSSPAADLVTNVYEVPKSFGQELTARSAGASDPFADPVSAGAWSGDAELSPRDLLESQGISFPAGSDVTYNPETSQLIVRNNADQMELVEALVDSVAPAPASAPPSPALAAAAAPAKMPETVTATIASGTSGSISTNANTSALTGDPSGIGGGTDSLNRKSAISEASEKATDLFATAHIAEKAKQAASAPAAQPADRLGESDSLALGSGGALALRDGSQLSKEEAVGESLKAIIALTGQLGQNDLGGTSHTKDRVIRRELPLEQEPLAKGLEAPSGIVKFGAGDLEISGGEHLNDRGLLVRIREKPTGSVNFGAGISQIESVTRFFEVTQSNFDARTVERLRNIGFFSKQAALDELSPATEPFSTFSLHVSDVSFQLAQAALAAGQWPEAEKIRIEEFVNAFDYGDPSPAMEERVSCRIDQAAHPFLQQRNLVRIALRTSAAGRTATTPLRLTILLDSSGSMERPDRRDTVRRAFGTLAGLLGENDRVTLITFARQPRLVADAVSGNEATRLVETVSALPSEGGTNLEAALQLGLEKAREHFDPAAQNRIVLMTDGATNLGDADADSLAARVVAMRQAGIAFDAAGFGADGVNDEVLEALTRNGDGRYYLLNRPEDAEASFAQQIAGALRPSAKNVKVQVEFDPARVKSYRLLGFEKHRLNTEDFRNDAVDAAELAASEAGVAVYQVEPDPGGTGDLGSVSVRFRDLESDTMIERRWVLPYHASAPRPEQGATSTLLATVASQFAAKLAGGPLGDIVDLGELAKLAAELPDGDRIQALRTMVEQARGLEGSP